MNFYDYVKLCQEETLSETSKEKKINQEDKTEERKATAKKGPACRGQVYRVEQGDTLYSISRKYHLKVRDLMMANPFVDMYRLRAGEELCIPVLYDPGFQEKGRPYLVKKDDTVLSVLNENHITFQELAKMNRCVQVLKLPAGTILLLP